jgi:Arc/MetJ family transcription regulator
VDGRWWCELGVQVTDALLAGVVMLTSLEADAYLAMLAVRGATGSPFAEELAAAARALPIDVDACMRKLGL